MGLCHVSHSDSDHVCQYLLAIKVDVFTTSAHRGMTKNINNANYSDFVSHSSLASTQDNPEARRPSLSSVLKIQL